MKKTIHHYTNYIPFVTAKLAKEKGFNLECDRYYNSQGELWTYNWGWELDGLPYKDCFAPTLSELQSWLMIEHNIICYVIPGCQSNEWRSAIKFGPHEEIYYNKLSYNKAFNTALLYGLNKIEL